MQIAKVRSLGLRAVVLAAAALLLIPLPVNAAYSPELTANVGFDEGSPVFDAAGAAPSGVIEGQEAASGGEVQGSQDEVTGSAYNAPRSLSPANYSYTKAGVTQVKTKWKLPAGAKKKDVTQYHWQISFDGNFDDPAGELYLKGTGVLVYNLEPYSHFYWRVSALYKDGTESAWSNIMVANVAKLKAPKLSSPASKSKQKKAELVFKWGKPKGMPSNGYYVLQLTTDPTFATVDYTWATLTTNKLTVTDIPPAGLTQTWYWRVKVVHKSYSDWDFSNFSAVRNFKR